MNWIDDIHNWHRFRSVQLGALAGVFGAMLTAYGVAYAITPKLVDGIPQWFLTFCSLGSMLSAGAGIWWRALKQTNLPGKPNA